MALYGSQTTNMDIICGWQNFILEFYTAHFNLLEMIMWNGHEQSCLGTNLSPVYVTPHNMYPDLCKITYVLMIKALTEIPRSIKYKCN